MIEVSNLTKRYGPITAVDDISFGVQKGEIVGFLGPNGAGKTTTMRMLTCFLPATAGTATIAGLDVFDQSLEVRRKIGYLPERPPLYVDMTVHAYLHYVASLSGLTGKDRERRIDAVEDRCSITAVDGRLIGHLSKGYRQRVGLAQALIHDPEVLILDEPTSGLDPKQINEIRGLIKELASEHTILLSTHILPEIEMTCERVIIINEGRIVARERIEDLSKGLRKSEKVFLETYDEPVGFEKAAGALPKVLRVIRSDEGPHAFVVESELGADVRRPLGQLVHEKGWGMKELRHVRLTLEDVFLKLTTTEPGLADAAAGEAADR